MGINPTQANFKSFTFDGKNSRNYGVYITGQGVFNAPERNVEMIEIPNRNGAYALDKGNFNNIEVTYPAGIFADTEADFAQAVSDLRNFLCSRVGYVRLEDDYNTGEYRMAIYKSGLEVSHDMLIAGEFDIVFECKPQRFLKSGETAISVTSGDTITNPTLFESSPILEVNGFGQIEINDAPINIGGGSIGWVKVSDSKSFQNTTGSVTIQTQYANSGDEIRLTEISNVGCEVYIRWTADGYTGAFIDSETGGSISWEYYANKRMFISGIIDRNISFYYGTASSHSFTANLDLYFDDGNGGYIKKTIVFGATLSYDGNDTFAITTTITLPNGFYIWGSGWRCFIGEMRLDSSQSALGSPLYIDLDIGEAYKIEGGVPVSVNNNVTIPSELPKLMVGSNKVEYEGTVTQLKVVPRWWQV